MQTISTNTTKKVRHKKQKEVMNVENTKAQMRKGVLEYCILSILNGHDKYASENGVRVNAVSLGMVEDAYEKYKDYFPGHNPVPMKKVVNAYVRSVKGKGNGEIIRIYE